MQSIPYSFRNLLWAGINVILPSRCVVTGDMVEEQGMISPKAWKELDFITAPFCGCCGMPFDFKVEDKALCASCLQYPPPFEEARAALVYGDGSRNLILGFKHADKTHAVRAFTPWLLRAGAQMLESADVLMPVPLHRWRLVSRRYNQSALMVKALERHTGISVCLDGIKRVRATVPQGHLGIKDRAKNVRRAFVVSDKHKPRIQGKAIVLVDDVYTTGATVKECSKALKKAGARAVSVLTLARVVRPGFD